VKKYLFSTINLTILSILAAFSDTTVQQLEQSQVQAWRLAGQQKQDQPKSQQTTGSLSRSDRDFVTKAAQDGMAEVALGELAARQASNNEVKQFARRMIDDHTKANNELKELASKEGITFPNELSARQKALQDRLAKLSGANFDREYMSAMVKDHDNAVALFQKESRSGSNPELKAWAKKTLPTLLEHQKMARDLAGKVSAKSMIAPVSRGDHSTEWHYAANSSFNCR
jgi:putative membrane protein